LRVVFGVEGGRRSGGSTARAAGGEAERVGARGAAGRGDGRRRRRQGSRTVELEVLQSVMNGLFEVGFGVDAVVLDVGGAFAVR
jgi:hypothetical protein